METNAVPTQQFLAQVGRERWGDAAPLWRLKSDLRLMLTGGWSLFQFLLFGMLNILSLMLNNLFLSSLSFT